MSLWVYENWRAHGHRATVHLASCAHCKAGTGQQGGTEATNGRWHGPFASSGAATEAALRTGAEVKRCGHCSPRA